jgi:VWFA-related protein
MSLTRRSLLGALPLLPAVRLLRGQQDQNPKPEQDAKADPNPTFSAGVRVVNLFATVRDKQGSIVKDLTKDDFVLDEDGRPQVIRYFSQESNLPLTVGLLVDTSGSTRRVLPDERMAAYRFLEQTLRDKEKDMAFLIHFDFDVELLQDLTSSRQRLEKALDELQTSDGSGLRRRGQGGGGGYPGGGYPGGGQRRGGGTCLYDSVLLASDEVLKKQAGRKAIILMTDGDDNGSKVSLSRAVEAAERADTLVYSILFEDPDMGFNGGGFGGYGRHGGGRPPMGGGDRPDGKKILQQISRETGGRFFEVSRRQPIQKVFEAIEEDLRNQYSLGYTPDRAGTSSDYRRIHLSAKPKNLLVQTREGYYPT